MKRILLALFILVGVSLSCVKVNRDQNRYNYLSTIDDNSVSLACLRMNVEMNNGILIYNKTLPPEDLLISTELYSFICDIIQDINGRFLKQSPDTKWGADSTEVIGDPPGDCVITSLAAWGDYSYGQIEQVAIDSCNYSPQNGIYVTEITHLMNILYQDSYDVYYNCPSGYSQPVDMVAVILYYDENAAMYRTHMVNVQIIMFGSIIYEGGASTSENIYCFYQKR